MWKQRENLVPLADSDTTEYRYCLDALLATIADMRATLRIFIGYGAANRVRRKLRTDIKRAEERAADLAHRLFERWIEVK